MLSERQFIEARFAIVRDELHKIEQQLEVSPYSVDHNQKIIVRREHRLLGKILSEVSEGQVLKALNQWRQAFSQKLTEHKQATREAQNQADAYGNNLPTIVKMLAHRRNHHLSASRSGISRAISGLLMIVILL